MKWPTANRRFLGEIVMLVCKWPEDQKFARVGMNKVSDGKYSMKKFYHSIESVCIFTMYVALYWNDFDENEVFMQYPTAMYPRKAYERFIMPLKS